MVAAPTAEPEAKPQTSTEDPTKHRRVRHFVELGDDGRPKDACLCGYVWDIYPIPHDPDSGICQECVDELRRRGVG